MQAPRLGAEVDALAGPLAREGRKSALNQILGAVPHGHGTAGPGAKVWTGYDNRRFGPDV